MHTRKQEFRHPGTVTVMNDESLVIDDDSEEELLHACLRSNKDHTNTCMPLAGQ